MPLGNQIPRALIATASPDLEKRGFFSGSFYYLGIQVQSRIRAKRTDEVNIATKKYYFFFKLGKKKAIIPISGK